MALTFNTKTYNAQSYDRNLVGYNGPAHTLTVKDYLVLGMTKAKPTAVFSGVSRSMTKLTRTLTLTGAETATGEMIFELKTSVPIGASSTDVNAAIADLAALLGLTSYQDLVNKQQISF